MNLKNSLGCIVEIRDESVGILTSRDALRDWAERPGQAWPCATIANGETACTAWFDSNGLYDLEGFPQDMDGREFDAWSSDVLGPVLPADHPCYLVCVGQFNG